MKFYFAKPLEKVLRVGLRYKTLGLLSIAQLRMVSFPRSMIFYSTTLIYRSVTGINVKRKNIPFQGDNALSYFEFLSPLKGAFLLIFYP